MKIMTLMLLQQTVAELFFFNFLQQSTALNWFFIHILIVILFLFNYAADIFITHTMCLFWFATDIWILV